MLFALLFAGLGSSAVVSRAFAEKPLSAVQHQKRLGAKPLSAVQHEKRLGPKPTPHWYWRWLQWRLGEGFAKGHPAEAAFRPKQAPRHMRHWAWRRLHFFLVVRKLRALQHARKRHAKPTTTTTTATTTNPSAGGDSYQQAIAYTQSRPAFSPARTIDVSSGSELSAAIANLRAGDLVLATADFTVSGETRISARLNSPAVIDLSGHTVKFLYSGGGNNAAVTLNNPQNVRIYGGDVSTNGTGGGCIFSTGMQNDLWWGFNAHDCGGSGLTLIPNTQPITGNDLQGEISRAGLNLAWDPHAEKGTGLHGAYLGNGANSFANNRLALYIHDQPTGAAIQYGADSGKTAPTNNVIYEKAVNLSDVATQQTGGNGIQFFGINGQSADIKYLQVDNAQGYALFDGGMQSGTTLNGVTVEYGRATNTNQNPRYHGQNPWRTSKGANYNDVTPTP
jgi:hypothetical protein